MNVLGPLGDEEKMDMLMVVVVIVRVCLIVAANTIAGLLMAMFSLKEAIENLHVRVHAATYCKELCRRWRQKPTSTSSLRFTTSNNIKDGNRCPQAATTSCTIQHQGRSNAHIQNEQLEIGGRRPHIDFGNCSPR